MNERQPRREFNPNFYMDLAYFHFVRLASEYGITPSIVNSGEMQYRRSQEPKARKFTDISRAFPAVEIPFGEGESKISGIDYGSGEIQIHYEHGDRAATISLEKDSTTGKVKLYGYGFTLYKRTVAGDHYSLEHLDTWGERPDPKLMTELLIRAEQVLKKRNEPKIEEKLDLKAKIKKRINDYIRESD